ncbi:MAG: hypothetical protein IK093_09240 [Ruminiclostridium sp.]|nr:hypothetical protein [Ruminiclostridium sp.]
MEKVFDFLRNKWVKRVVSLFSLGLPVFVAYIDWLAFAYYLEPVNNVPLFLLYILVNFVFAGIMFYTRRQLLTQLVACVTPILAFVLLIIAFGQWYLIAPPVVICAFTFLAAGTNETFKTILGTVYLLMFVVGTLVYLTMLHFNLTVRTFLAISECDITKRSENYSYSPDEKYRLVMYVDDAGNERSLTTYYVEKTEDDIKLPYLNCYKHLYSQKVLVTMDQSSVVYKWLNNNDLYIDGRARNIKTLFEQAEEKRNNPEEEEEEEDTEVLTYYEMHDFDSEEYFGTAETTPAVAEVAQPEEEQNFE